MTLGHLDDACAVLWLGHDHRLPKRNSISMVRRVVTIFPSIVNGSLAFVMVIPQVSTRNQWPVLFGSDKLSLYYTLSKITTDLICQSYVLTTSVWKPPSCHIRFTFPLPSLKRMSSKFFFVFFFRSVGKLTVQLKLLMSFY